MLEGSKDFAKEFMARNSIPTAKYATFEKKTIKEGYEFLNTLKPAGDGETIIEFLPLTACIALITGVASGFVDGASAPIGQ